MFGENKTEEGAVSKKIQRGKNTTTSVRLYPIKGGYIADTPGFSTFSIEEIASEELASYFIEFRDYLLDCEYTDCKHEKEECCGIKKAVEEGNIEKARYERYCKIKKELEDKEEHRW